MSVSVIIACHGDIAWANLAWSRAYPSAFSQSSECLVVYEREGSVATARNKGAMEATGEWLVFLDADDELEVGYIDALQAALAVDPDPHQLLAPRVSYVESGYKQTPKYWHHGVNDIREGNWMVIGTAVHRDTFDRAGGFREWPVYEDWDLWIRCHLQADARPVRVPEMVYVAHVGQHSRNRSLPMVERNKVHAEIVAANFG